MNPKEKIYTIPVMDGFKAGGECPFCNMLKVLDENAVNYMLGPSYMEDDIRLETDKQGFCKGHYEKMYVQQNRLGLSLMLHTHFQKINKELSAIADSVLKAEPPKKGLFKKQPIGSDSDRLYDFLEGVGCSCYICNKVQSDFTRFIDTFFYMWEQNAIVEQVRECNGFCLEHFLILCRTAEKKLKPGSYKEFIQLVLPKQLENLKRLEEELDWFIKKFDYRFQNEPWYNSKDALNRAILKICGLEVD